MGTQKCFFAVCTPLPPNQTWMKIARLAIVYILAIILVNPAAALLLQHVPVTFVMRKSYTIRRLFC